MLAYLIPRDPCVKSSTAQLRAVSPTLPVRAGGGGWLFLILGGGNPVPPCWELGSVAAPWHHPWLQMSQPAAKSRIGEQQPVQSSEEESSTPLIKAGSDFKQMCTAQLLLALLCAAARLGQFIGAASSALVGSICAVFVRWLV